MFLSCHACVSAWIHTFTPASSKEVIDIQATIECGFTLKHVRDMIRIYMQMQRSDKYSQHSSIIWPVWINGWVFVYELSGCGFESSCINHHYLHICHHDVTLLLFCFISTRFLVRNTYVKNFRACGIGYMRNFIKIRDPIIFGPKCQNRGIWTQIFKDKWQIWYMLNFVKIRKLILFGPKLRNHTKKQEVGAFLGIDYIMFIN